MKSYICVLLFSIFTQYSSGASRCNTVFTALISNVETRTFHVNVGANFFKKMGKITVNVNDFIGKRFGSLVILSRAADGKFKNGKRKYQIECQCDCGIKKVFSFYGVTKGNSKSCGCIRRANHLKAVVKHGCARDSGHSGEYASWAAMKSRCHDKKVRSYKNYGGRGITVCERWNKFENFLEDMGRRPVEGKYIYSIERINNELGYYKENCKWATYKEQSVNKRIRKGAVVATINGVTKPVRHWAREMGLNEYTVSDRIYAGKMTPEKALLHKYRADRKST